MARDSLRNKKRIVVKVGSSSLVHAETNRADLVKMDRLVRELSDLRSSGHDVILVTSAAIALGKSALRIDRKPDTLEEKQACAAIGQARIITIYQHLFGEYDQIAAQILLTKANMLNPVTRTNARNTLEQLLKMNAIPIINENDSVAVSEIEQLPHFGDNDTLSAVIAALIDADLLILLSDIDGLYTDNPRTNRYAAFIPEVWELDDSLLAMGKGPGTAGGTGGMMTKLFAARIAMDAGTDMIIANGNDFENIHRIMDGEEIGTIFRGARTPDFSLATYLDNEDQTK